MLAYVAHTAEQFPALLKAFRKQAGLTQGEVAALLGVTQQSFSALERNAHKASAERLLQLFGILGVEMLLRSKGQHKDEAGEPSGESPSW